MLINELLVFDDGIEQEIVRELSYEEVSKVPKEANTTIDIYQMVQEAYVEAMYASTLAEIIMQEV